MIPILLCDDDDKIRNEIARQVNNQILIQQYDMEIAVSCVGRIKKDSYEKKYLLSGC